MTDPVDLQDRVLPWLQSEAAYYESKAKEAEARSYSPDVSELVQVFRANAALRRAAIALIEQGRVCRPRF